jgi:hypothetical protein
MQPRVFLRDIGELKYQARHIVPYCCSCARYPEPAKYLGATDGRLSSINYYVFRSPGENLILECSLLPGYLSKEYSGIG